MPIPMLNILALTAVIAGLSAVIGLKKQITSVDRSSYLHMVAGLLVLSLAALGELLNQTSLFAAVPFLSDPLFLRLTISIVLITGTTLLFNGLSTWLPLAREFRKYHKQQFDRIGAMREIEQHLIREDSLQAMTRYSLKSIVERFDIDHAALYMHSSKSDRSELMVGQSASDTSTEIFRQVQINLDELAVGSLADGPSYLSAVKNVPAELGKPGMALPIRYEGKSAGMVLLWHREAVKDDDRVTLKLIVERLAQRMRANKDRNELTRRIQAESWASDLTSLTDRRLDLKTNFGRLGRELCTELGVDSVSLTLQSARNHLQRFSVGLQSGVLHERIVDYQNLTPLESGVLKSAAPMTGSSLSRHAVPLIDGSDCRGVLEFDCSESGPITAGKQLKIQAATSVILPLLINEQKLQDQQLANQRQEAINHLLKDFASNENIGDCFKLAARTISDQVRTTFVRISACDDSSPFLNSCALTSLRGLETRVPHNGFLVRSLMPQHNQVIRSRQPLTISRQHEQSTMSEAEAIQSFVSEVKSAMIVPVEAEDRVHAVISLGEMRQAERFRYEPEDLLFVSTVASALALRIGDYSKRRIHSTERTRAGTTEFPDSLTSTKSNLTSSVAAAINPISNGVSDTPRYGSAELSERQK